MLPQRVGVSQRKLKGFFFCFVSGSFGFAAQYWRISAHRKFALSASFVLLSQRSEWNSKRKYESLRKNVYDNTFFTRENYRKHAKRK